jgi:hypothetical protein
MSVSALLNGILDINVKKLNTNEIESIGNLNITAPRIILSSNGIGEATIPNGDTEVKVDVKGMNNDAIILLTPRDNIVNFWVEPDNGEFFTIYTDTAPHTDVRFFYFILSYE